MTYGPVLAQQLILHNHFGFAFFHAKRIQILALYSTRSNLCLVRPEFCQRGSTHVLSCNVLHFYEAFPHLNELPFVYFSTFFSPRLHTRGVSSPRHALVTPQRFRLKEKELPSAIQGNDGAVLTSQSHNGDVDEQSLWTLAHIYGIINGLLKSLWVILHPLMS